MTIQAVDDKLLGVPTPEVAAPEAPPPMDEPEHPEQLPPENEDGESTDEYGNEIPAPKMYTQEEVNEQINRVMRDRAKRGQFANKQEADEAAKDFNYDAKSDDSWEKQLETFMEGYLTKRDAKRQQFEQQNREQVAQAEFESKLMQGMGKYSDFESVITGKPFTDAMTVATRGMDNPAAFIYAAAKTQAKELERISKLSDPYSQMREIGKLEERMRKTTEKSNAPTPIRTTKGDIGGREHQSIDDKIAAHAKRTLSRR